MDFVSPALANGPSGSGLFTTWPLEIKAHDFWSRATVQCNVNAERGVWWATGYPGMTIEQWPFTLVDGTLHRMTWQMDMVSDPAKGRFQASIDGQRVVDMGGQMALTTGDFAGCAAYVPCLYSNQLKAETHGYLPSMILSTAPIPGT